MPEPALPNGCKHANPGNKARELAPKVGTEAPSKQGAAHDAQDRGEAGSQYVVDDVPASHPSPGFR